MNKINLGQFIKNIFDYSTGKPVKQQPSKIANEKFLNAQNEMIKTIQKTAQNIAQNYVQNQDILNTQMMLKELSKMEKTMLLRQMFDFPESLTQLMEQFIVQDKSLTIKEIAKLMAKELDISKLVILMQSNGKGALEKLSKLIATMNQSGIYNTQQLKEMSVLINACIPTAETPQTQVLKNLMIMYLPWLPLNESTEFNIDTGTDNEEVHKNNDDEIIIFITTKNFGTIKIILFKENNEYQLCINCPKNFPKERFNNFIQNENCIHIKSTPTYTIRQSEHEEKKETLKIEFTQSTKVSPQLLIIIHALIRIISELDNIESLAEKRKQDIL